MRIIFGIQPVREVIRAQSNKVARVLIEHSDDPKLHGIAKFASDRGIPVTRTSRSDLDKQSHGGRHQGVLAFAPDLRILSAAELAVTPETIVLALDGIMDPQNFGAVIRSAVALGPANILWPEHSSAPLSPATFRASAGAVEHAALCRVSALPSVLEDLKARGATVVGLDAQGSHELGSIDLRGPTVIVLGAEDKGMRKSVRRACSHLARLPMTNAIDSLNASVAAAVALYEVRRQRTA